MSSSRRFVRCDWDGVTLPWRPNRPCILYYRLRKGDDHADATTYYPDMRVHVPDHRGYYWNLAPNREYWMEFIIPASAVKISERLPVQGMYETTQNACVQADSWLARPSKTKTGDSTWEHAGSAQTAMAATTKSSSSSSSSTSNRNSGKRRQRSTVDDNKHHFAKTFFDKHKRLKAGLTVDDDDEETETNKFQDFVFQREADDKINATVTEKVRNIPADEFQENLRLWRRDKRPLSLKEGPPLDVEYQVRGKTPAEKDAIIIRTVNEQLRFLPPQLRAELCVAINNIDESWEQHLQL